MKRKADEENWDEAESQAYRCWTDTVVRRFFLFSSYQTLTRLQVPPEIASLFTAHSPSSDPESSFHILLSALRAFSQLPDPGGVLPLTSALPDMKADTRGYIGLQTLYKVRILPFLGPV
jgi:amyloid beta precursor protein binding protein 1